MKAFVRKSLADFLKLFKVSGLNFESQHAAGHGRIRVGVSIVDSRYVCSAAGYYCSYINKLTGLVLERYLQCSISAARNKSSGYDS